MRHKPRRFTAALVVFSLFFQLLPLPALATGTQPVSGGVLGVFDPTLLPNGYYTVRLTVEAGGAQGTKEITVSVEGELEVGSFSMSFIDMDMPIHGLPLSVVRTYDSHEKDRSGRGSISGGRSDGVLRIAERLSDRPRKCLGFRTPNEAFFNLPVAFDLTI